MRDETPKKHVIDWPPASMHRHPSTVAAPLAALGCVVSAVILTFLACYGLYALVWR